MSIELAPFEVRGEFLARQIWREAIKPDKVMTVDEWSDAYRKLDRKASAEPGTWKTERTPYLREIMQVLSPSDPTQEVVFVKGSQIGGSEALQNFIMAYMDLSPCPILAVQPTIETAQRWSKQRIAPGLELCDRLRDKVAAPRSRDSSNSLLQKDFNGGTLIIGGGNSAAGLRSMPIRCLALDEVDAYPEDADGEGDPVALAVRRTATFKRRKIFYNSTPVHQATSRIWKFYQDSDKRVFQIPCPHCGEYQEIQWENIRWPEGNPDAAALWCTECGAEIPEHNKTAMLSAGKWVAQNPGHPRAGFMLSALYSPVGWYSWADAARDSLKARDPEAERVFVNTVLGLPWTEEGATLEAEELERRRVDYRAEVPRPVLVLTAGVDVQDDRLEVEVVGWGLGKESWGVRYAVFMGDPAQGLVWRDLDDFLRSGFMREDGRTLPISGTCVDSGGHFTQQVYAWCRAREHRRIFAVKGKGGAGVPMIGKATRNNRYKAALFPVGTDNAKSTIYARLRLEDHGPGSCHFPRDLGTGYTLEYFTGLCSERREVKFVSGQTKLVWVKKSRSVRNEPLDVRVYATAALEILNPRLEAMAARESAEPQRPAQAVQRPYAPRPGTEQKRVAPAVMQQAQDAARGRRVVSRGVSL